MSELGQDPKQPLGAGAQESETERAQDSQSGDPAEMAHVLFMDVVAYSTVLGEDQRSIIDQLQQVVENSKEFRRAHARHELIALPTGDGMALVFMGDPAAPVRCALEIAAALRNHPEIPLRMGVNSGPVFRRQDITGKENVSGAGIDYAQRAMDRGDKGHILLTKPTADFLSHLGAWSSSIHDIGQYEIKHRKKIQLYNLYRGDLGNAKTPAHRVPSPIPVPVRVPRWMPLRIVALVGAGALILAAGAWIWPASTPDPLQPSLTKLTARPGQELFPNLSQDGKSLIYASKTDGKWRICRQALTGNFSVAKVERLMPDSTVDDTQPALSPDNQSIAFRSERDGGGVFKLDLNDGSVRQLTSRGYNPAWSPDGKQVVCAMESIFRPEDRATTKSKLWTASIETGETNLLYEGDAVQPSWSPNGLRIAFWYVHDGGVRDIATIPAGGGPRETVTEDRSVSWEPHELWHGLKHGTRISQDRYMNWNPVWSPDGKYIYFASDRGGNMGLWRVRIVEETGKVLSTPQLVTQSSEDRSHIRLANDGKHFVFVQRSYAADLQRAEFDPASEKIVGGPTCLLEGSVATRPDVSPSGDALIFNSSSGNRDKLVVFRTASNEARQLIEDSHKDRGPRWSPDGKRIAFFSNRSKNWEIWTIRPDGSGLQQLTDVHEVGMIYPVWSPRGDRLAYTLSGKTPEETQTGIIDLGKPSKANTSRHTLAGLGGTNESFTAWSWSPDESTLAGYRQRFDGKFTGIGILNLKTQRYESLTEFGSDPVWLSDGRRLLFHREGQIWLVDRLKKDHVKSILSIAPHEVARRGFGVSRNGRFIYFSQEKIQSEIWLGTLQ